MLRRKFTPAEHLLAQRLYRTAEAQGRLKPPSGLGAVATSDGLLRSGSVSATTYRDYLRDARKMLKGRSERRWLAR